MVPTLCIIDTLIQKTGVYVSYLELYQGSGWILQVTFTPGGYITLGDTSGFRMDTPGPLYTRGISHTWRYNRVQDGYSRSPMTRGISHTSGAMGSGWILQVPFTLGGYITPGTISGFRMDGFSIYPLHQRDIHPCKVVVQGSY